MIISYKELKESDYHAAFLLWEKTEGMSIGIADTLESFNLFLQRNQGLSFGAFIQEDLIGTVLCGTDGRRGYIYHLSVEKEQRGIGIGSKLLSQSIFALKKEGIEKCHIFVFKNNETGNAFWEKSGWKKRDDINVYSIDL
ncbi:MAG: GNAT family N-acetyltransferase [Spirochaetes bacterium]|nr:GNAT family N-acetyltransferase [Spirochaetota bacterium]